MARIIFLLIALFSIRAMAGISELCDISKGMLNRRLNTLIEHTNKLTAAPWDKLVKNLSPAESNHLKVRCERVRQALAQWDLAKGDLKIKREKIFQVERAYAEMHFRSLIMRDRATWDKETKVLKDAGYEIVEDWNGLRISYLADISGPGSGTQKVRTDLDFCLIRKNVAASSNSIWVNKEPFVPHDKLKPLAPETYVIHHMPEGCGGSNPELSFLRESVGGLHPTSDGSRVSDLINTVSR